MSPHVIFFSSLPSLIFFRQDAWQVEKDRFNAEVASLVFSFHELKRVSLNATLQLCDCYIHQDRTWPLYLVRPSALEIVKSSRP